MSAPTPDGGMAPARLARIAGVCYLAVIGGGVFAALFGREPLFTAGDAAATASAIAAHFLASWLMVPCFVGEFSLALWLAVKGVRATEPGVA